MKATLEVAGDAPQQNEDGDVVPGGAAAGHGGRADDSEGVGGGKKPVPHGSVEGRLAPQVICEPS